MKNKRYLIAALMFGSALLMIGLNASGLLPDWPLYVVTIGGMVGIVVKGAIAR
jgi:hypothetical protein